MNILWIEDFGGSLDSGSATLNLMFQDLVSSFDDWDEDEFSLLTKPADLEIFFKKYSALHCVYLCRHYFDYETFKEEKSITKKIDALIIDIRLNHKVDFDKPIPIASQEKEKFHNNAGFYIFNDLVHLGFPANKMCFMTGEKNSLTEFEAKCADLYIPKVFGFEKSEHEYKKLRVWIKGQETDYTILRRGIIEECGFLKTHIENDDDNIQFRDFIKKEKNQPAIEMPSTDIKNYLGVLSQCLAIKQPDDDLSINIQYRLFLRTLVHEWEKNIDPQSLKEKYASDTDKINDIYTFAWIMKMTRNWVSHANLLVPLNPEIIAFLFLVNMRRHVQVIKRNAALRKNFVTEYIIITH